MLVQSIVLGLIGVFVMLDSRLLGRLNFERPLIVGTLVGLALGDLEKGLLVGASIELISLGVVQVGAAVPADMTLGAVIATAFAILSGSNAETALTIAIPIAILGQLLGILMRTVLASPAYSHCLGNHSLLTNVFCSDLPSDLLWNRPSKINR